MLSYEVLDAIADSYIPLLVLYSLFLIARKGINNGVKYATAYLLVLFAGILPVYLIMYFDILFKVWPMFGLDYSTHTALTIAVVAYLSVYNTKYIYYFIGSLVGYCLLMLYQQYHTLLDIVTTAVVIYPIVLGIYWLGRERLQLK